MPLFVCLLIVYIIGVGCDCMNQRKYIKKLELFLDNAKRLNLTSEQLHILLLIDIHSDDAKKLVSGSELAELTLMDEKKIEAIMGELLVNKLVSMDSSGRRMFYSTAGALNLVFAPESSKNPSTFKELFEAKLKRELKAHELEIVTGWQESGITNDEMSKILLNITFEDQSIPFHLIYGLINK